jgi:hypothetical protein
METGKTLSLSLWFMNLNPDSTAPDQPKKKFMMEIQELDQQSTT